MHKLNDFHRSSVVKNIREIITDKNTPPEYEINLKIITTLHLPIVLYFSRLLETRSTEVLTHDLPRRLLKIDI